MAISIDELQVETQTPAPPAPAANGGDAKSQPKLDFGRELQKLREREVRLRAD